MKTEYLGFDEIHYMDGLTSK